MEYKADESDVFVKHDSNVYMVDKANIIKNIPKNHVKEIDYIKRKTFSEWRWRFLLIRGKELVEISCLKKNGERKYFDKYGNWTDYELGDAYDKFVTNVYYYYALEAEEEDVQDE